MMRINEERFLQKLADLSVIGRLPEEEGGGLDRRPFSAVDRAARDFFCQKAKAANLEVATDAAANLSAKLPGDDAGARTLLLGSHLDTVPNGGSYDGALGVLAALEVLRTLRENRISLPVHLEAVAFTDEEGRFYDFFGSKALVGDHSNASIGAFLTRAGEYPDNLTAIRKITPGGLSIQAVHSAHRDPETIAGFIELHIEQGPHLEGAGIPIGVVDVIYGRRSMQIHFLGRSDHAGTTPFHLRADALVAAAQFVFQAPQTVLRNFPEAIVTCGSVMVKPSVYNVVPGEATVLVEFRASTATVMHQVERALYALAEESTISPDLSFTVQPVDHHEPVAMNPSIQTAMRRASECLGYPYTTLSSGAGHDAQELASFTPTGMIFVPSNGGRSHCPEEHTEAKYLVAGANVLLHTVLTLAREWMV